MNESQLLDLKKKVDAAKTEVSQLQGHQTALMNQLKTDWGCKTIEEAEKKIKVMKTEIEKLDESIQTGIEELEEKYNG